MSDGAASFEGVEDAMGILKVLIGYYRRGLTAPLRFFPVTSLEYAKDQTWNLERARKFWEGDPWRKGEREDPYFRLCFSREDPFTPEFHETARAILGALVRHRRQV